MALANVAALLSQWGHSVLAIDWDLEAPGLERYFAGDGVLGGHRSQVPGLLDLIIGQQTGPPVQWRQCVIKAYPFGRGGGNAVDLILAGQENSDYTKRLHSLEWNRLFTQRAFGDFLERLRTEWINEYEYILIDSRTGVTDIGGICTVQLPDVLVLFFAANQQNIDGVVNTVIRAREARQTLPIDRDFLMAIPVPSRIDKWAEIETGRFWKNSIAEQMGPFYLDWLGSGSSPSEVIDQLIIPYISFWSFGERLPVVEEGTSDKYGLGSAYELLGRLIENRLDWSAVGRKSSVQPQEISNADKAESAYQSLPEAKKEQVWPLFSLALSGSSGDLSHFGVVARPFVRAELITFNRFSVALRDQRLAYEWPRLVNWIKTDKALLDFQKRVERLMDDQNEPEEITPGDIASAKLFYPARRIHFIERQQTFIRNLLRDAILPILPELRTKGHIEETTENLFQSLSSDDQALFWPTLSFLIFETFPREKFPWKLRPMLNILFRAGVISIDEHYAPGAIFKLTDPDLIFLWPRLEKWIESDNVLLSTRRSIRAALQTWESMGEDPLYLLKDNLLESATNLVKTRSLFFTRTEIDFVSDSSRSFPVRAFLKFWRVLAGR
jgi:hypothetical protein